jgi:hypothetical protein
VGTSLVFFPLLKQRDETMALGYVTFRLLEAVLIVIGIISFLCLLSLRQAYVAGGQLEWRLAMGKAAVDSTDYAYTLHTLPFAYGACLFYFLLDKTRLVPRPLSLWGLISVLPFLIGVPLSLPGVDFPFFFHLPYAPFEFVIGAWSLLARHRETSS